ncbi:oligopeptide/dipeptide ABC transporter, ATPase subunit [Thermodesulfatator indicus DSM 15286]|uniref:Nickel import system ATP-binding protein NikD n=1 Tax=Thermodesulfatator indicus (strain DSM 15286 / JCM 11887 / CIR29812) TaxID=667014 RepID=F8AB61_THEID|nr:ABC transporter ATP-binding protein [Thermodesulfatator indicus]AEH45517.1 oligopeptide/dipeptide ABC transporter, ATPase subunit [Thermodesulfatator indicus DSM 15286]
MKSLLNVKNLSVHFMLEEITVKAVDRASIEVKENEVLTLIGESGSGKSVLGMAILKLLPSNIKIGGRIDFNGFNLLELPEEKMKDIRGQEIAWVPQNPSSSLNPVLKVGFQIAEPMEVHLGYGRKTAWQKAIDLLRFFDIRPPEKRAKQYPHQYSGGMRQRALVAMGTSTRPKLIIADEPTKGVDATKKIRVIELFRKIRNNHKPSLLIITHDLPFAEKLADRVAVMYCGQVVEVAKAETFFNSPLHPYSKALLESLPSKGLKPIKGLSPSMIDPPKGCRFRPRCDYATDKCFEEPPFNGQVRCWLYA